MGHFRQALLKLDVFAKPVQLNFRRQENFATVRGGLLSALVYLFSAWFSIAILIRFIYRIDPVIQ